MVGHLLGAAGAISALTAIGAIRDGIIPPTINLENPDLPECDLDYVPQRQARGAGRHGDDQRLRVRRPERGRDLPALQRLTVAARGAQERDRRAAGASSTTTLTELERHRRRRPGPG